MQIWLDGPCPFMPGLQQPRPFPLRPQPIPQANGRVVSPKVEIDSRTILEGVSTPHGSCWSFRPPVAPRGMAAILALMPGSIANHAFLLPGPPGQSSLVGLVLHSQWPYGAAATPKAPNTSMTAMKKGLHAISL